MSLKSNYIFFFFLMKLSTKKLLFLGILIIASSSLAPKGSGSSRNSPSDPDTNNEKGFFQILNKNYTQFQVKKICFENSIKKKKIEEAQRKEVEFKAKSQEKRNGNDEREEKKTYPNIYVDMANSSYLIYFSDEKL